LNKRISPTNESRRQDIKTFVRTTVLFGLVAIIAGCGLAADDAAVEEASPQEQASLYDRLGGEAAITAVVDRFIDELSNDDMLNDNPAIRAARDSVDPDELKAEVTALVCQATGGPQEYTGRTMAESHAHMNISGSEWDQMITIFVSLLDEFSVPEAEQGELLPIVESTKADIVLRPDQ